MKRTLGTGGLIVLAALTASCSFKIFEDVGTDPHPPTIELTSLVHYEAPTESATSDKAPSSPQRQSITWDSGGFTLSEGQKFQVGLTYHDAGGDILGIHLRDRDGATNLDFVPIDVTYFSGTSGILLGPKDGAELTGLLGRHRLELWAEDSHLSRSEKVAFDITLVP